MNKLVAKFKKIAAAVVAFGTAALCATTVHAGGLDGPLATNDWFDVDFSGVAANTPIATGGTTGITLGAGSWTAPTNGEAIVRSDGTLSIDTDKNDPLTLTPDALPNTVSNETISVKVLATPSTDELDTPSDAITAFALRDDGSTITPVAYVADVWTNLVYANAADLTNGWFTLYTDFVTVGNTKYLRFSVQPDGGTRTVLVDSQGDELFPAANSATKISSVSLTGSTSCRTISGDYLLDAVASVNGTNYATFDAAITAAGGTYDIIVLDNAAAVPAGWKIADGKLVEIVYVAQIVNGATTNKFETLAAAIADAQNGDTIELLADVDFGTMTNPGSSTGAVTIPAGKTVTLDLAGHKISVALNTNGNTYYNAHVLLVQGNLTVEDTSVEKTGEFINTYNNSYECTRAVRVMSGGTLTMNGGTVTATTGEAMRVDGTATLNAGVTVQAIKSADYGGWDNSVAGIELRGNATLTVNGAVVRSIGRAAIYSDAASNVITLNSGVFAGSANHGAIYGTKAQESVSVKGGYYSSDPTDFINPQQHYAALVSEGDYAGYYFVAPIAPVLSTVTTSEELADALAASTPQAPAYVTVSGDITIDTTVELPFGAALTVPNGSALRVVDNGVLINNGEITSAGTIEVTGTGFLSKPSSVDGVLSGYTFSPDEEAGTVEYEIRTPMDLQWISWLGNQKDVDDTEYRYYNWDVKVANDIVFPDGVEFEKITAFTGVFDGQGHEISNLVLRATSDINAIFRSLNNATILNTEITATVETVSGYTGTLAYITYGKVRIDGVTLNGTMTATGATYGIAPFVVYPYNTGAGNHLYIGNCVNNMTVSALNGWNTSPVCGTTGNTDWNGGKLGVYNFVNNGSAVCDENSAGYVVGYSMSPNLTIEIINYENNGSASTEYGQIAFDCTKPATFCANSGASWSSPVFDLTYASTNYTAYYHEDEDIYNTVLPPAARIVRDNGATTNKYETIAAAISASQDGDTIELLKDIQLSGTEAVEINKVGTYTIDGKGHSITPASDCAYTHTRFRFGMDGNDYTDTKSYIVTNLTISGFTDAATYFIRAEGCSLTLTDCTIADNNLALTSGSRLVVITDADLTLDGCEITDNATASYLVDFNTNGRANGTGGTLDIDNCLFDGNTSGETAIVYSLGSSSGGDAIANSTFSSNTVSSAAASVIYFSGATDVTGCLFTNNTVTATDSSQKCGVLALGSSAAGSSYTNNAFADNTLTSSGNAATIYVGAKNVGLTGNYWGNGAAPVSGNGADIYLAKTEGVVYDTYAESYTVNANGRGVTVVLHVGYTAGDDIQEVIGSTSNVVLTATEADYLNSIIASTGCTKTEIETALAGMTVEDFKDAALLNIDITKGYAKPVFNITAIKRFREDDTQKVRVTVKLDRGDNTLVSPPIKGVLRLMISSDGKDWNKGSEVVITNDHFATGDLATFTLPIGNARIFKAIVIDSAEAEAAGND